MLRDTEIKKTDEVIIQYKISIKQIQLNHKMCIFDLYHTFNKMQIVRGLLAIPKNVNVNL